MANVMKVLLCAAITLVFAVEVMAQASEDKRVRQAVEAFYAAFNAHGFDRAKDYTTEDWYHINPLGGSTRGREAVLKELQEVHSTFLKGVSDTIEDMNVRFATPDVAVATVTSRIMPLLRSYSASNSSIDGARIHGIACAPARCGLR